MAGEQKVRPGTYVRYWNRGTPPAAGVDDGVCAAVFRSHWGPLNTPVEIENFADVARIFGTGGTTAVPIEQFRGGARRVVCCRVGIGGKRAEGTITDADGNDALKVTMKYHGNREFYVTLRPALAAPDTTGEMLLLEGTTVLERFTFALEAPGADASEALVSTQASRLVAAAKGSRFFDLDEVSPKSTGVLVPQSGDNVVTEIKGGVDPDETEAAYSKAFEALEGANWNVLSIDTNDVATHEMMQMFLNRVYAEGMFVMGVVGEPTSVGFEDRLTNAAAFNDYQMVYVGNGFVDAANERYEGWLAAARVAGMIAGTPSSQAVTRLAVRNAVDLTERLANRQVEQALQSGMLVFTRSANNTVWVEQGVNTLVTPKSHQDNGWQKIKRAKVRFELFSRLTRSVAPLIGRINNDPDGRMTVIQLCNTVCNAMVAEGKLLSGAHVELDPANPPQGDSAWFQVFADDIDALEKAYFAFGFRFAPDEA